MRASAVKTELETPAQELTQTGQPADPKVHSTEAPSTTVRSTNVRSTKVRSTNVLDTKVAENAFDLPAQLKAVQQQTGKSLQQIVIELAKLSFGPGKVSAEEYFMLRLFDDEALAGQDKKSFAGVKGGKSFALDVNYNDHWLVATGHKMAFEAMMTGFGYPTPRTRALYSKDAKYPAMTMLRTAEDLTTYLRDAANYPLFGKPMFSSLSLGTVGLEAIDSATGMLRLLNGSQVSVDGFVADVTAHYEDGYILQEQLRPHGDVEAICGNRLPTVRFYTLNGPKGPELFRAVWKMPVSANMSDNYWRSGNILAALDYETGTVTRAISGAGLAQIELEAHPDTGAALIGAGVPDWDASLAMVLDAAEVLGEIPLIGWDVAPSDRGGVIVEANDMPDFRLVQMAERRGIIDEQYKAMLPHVKRIKERMKTRSADIVRAAKKKQLQRTLNG